MDKEQYSVFHYSVLGGNLDIIQFLINNNVDINQQANDILI